MSTTVPESFHALLNGPTVTSLATMMPNGQIQVNPVWCNFVDGFFYVNSSKGNAKDKNMRARPTVTTLVIDPQNPYKWGKVVDIDEEGADEHIDNLSEMYINERPFPWMSNVNYFVRSASIMMAAFSISWFDCFVASVDNSLLPV